MKLVSTNRKTLLSLLSQSLPHSLYRIHYSVFLYSYLPPFEERCIAWTEESVLDRCKYLPSVDQVLCVSFYKLSIFWACLFIIHGFDLKYIIPIDSLCVLEQHSPDIPDPYHRLPLPPICSILIGVGVLFLVIEQGI